MFCSKNLDLLHFYREFREKQHTHFEDKILRKFANEDKSQVVQACVLVALVAVHNCNFNTLVAHLEFSWITILVSAY